MISMMKLTKTISLAILTSLLLLAAMNYTVLNVKAQNQATVTILSSIGGITDPANGTYQYNDGATVTITPTADGQSGFTFANWIISTPSGTRISLVVPLTFTVSAGSTYTVQAVFQVIQPIGVQNLPKNLSTAAIVVILPAAGGTTIPAPGTYAFDNATSLNITAMPNSGWTFSHWVISGSDVTTGHGSIPTNLEPTDNPYNINHGYGNTYAYQAVFTQTSASPTPTSQSPTPTSPSPSPTIPELSGIAIGILLLAMIPVVIAVGKRRLILK
jgi:hypothetical protein